MSTAAAYQSTDEDTLRGDRQFYTQLANTNEKTCINKFVIPIRSGRAWEVPSGHTCKIIALEGPQVGDLNLWHRDNPKERFWASRTRQLHAAHVTTFDRLWSTLPYLRPLATIINDSLNSYGCDSDGGRVHDLLGTRCDPYVNKMLMNESFDFHCHSNLTRAIMPYGLTEYDVHDVLNVFQCTGLNSKDQYFMKKCPAKKGDFFEFFAEINLLCALSTCPGGDLSLPLWGPEAKDPVEVCRPLGIEVYKVNDTLLHKWSSPDVAFKNYTQMHGLKVPEWSL